MAKTTKRETHSFIADFADLMWVPDLNEARPTKNYGDKAVNEQLERALAQSGWWKGPNGEVSADTIEGRSWKVKGEMIALITYRDKEMAKRQTLWEAHKAMAASDPTKAVNLQVFEMIFVDKGKLKIPTYIGVTGNRRAAKFLDAMIRRRGMKSDGPETKPGANDGEPGKGPPLEMEFTLPVSVNDFTDELERIGLQVRENVGKMVGNLSTSWVDMLLIARRELALGASQTRIREQFGDSNGVKLYMMCLLNSKYPEVRIIERATLPPEDPDWIPVQSVKYPILQGMAQRFDAQSTDAYNKKNANKDGFEKKPILSGEEVMAYFSDVKKNPEGDGGPKAMDKNAMKTIEDINSNPLVAWTARRIRTNTDFPEWNTVEDFSPCVKSLVILREDRDLPRAQQILEALAKIPTGDEREFVFSSILELLNPAPKKRGK